MRSAVLILGGVLLLAAACTGGQAPAGETPGALPVFEPTAVRRVVPGASLPAGPAVQPSGSAGCGTPTDTGDLVGTIETSEGKRSFRVHLPAGYQPARAAPLVLNFHGYARDALQQETYSALIPLADAEGFILVTPDGSGYPLQWDIVGVYGDSGIDDVAAVAQMVEHLGNRYCVDVRRVYATGISNGGEMAAQVGCVLPSVFAAVAPVAGVVYQGCTGRPMPVISFHGTWDYNVPFETAQPGMAEWARHNGCEGELEVEPVSEHVTREAYGGCNGADAVLYVIEGGGHTWPDAEDESGGVGPTTHEINANRLMWAFFEAHPMPAAE